ncbi:glycosyltransferase family 4 protein [Acidocella sp.]|uniref:glycosyltransferase family 4 protein n=1 Tax=Acidocella sp. TaxID=50710 RepID=UPI0026382CC4|nr:undecaprenyl/decaprenyl-phosphate alpha-N-acetylglucosaminyl 1-phosphate transferase [Acidocella sp.]
MRQGNAMLPSAAALHALPRALLLLPGLALVSALAVRLMIVIGVQDRPDPRKAHRTPMPKAGGVGIVAAFVLGVQLHGAPGLRAALPAILLMAAMALLDDLLTLGFMPKLLAQLAAGLVALAAGFGLHRLSLPLIGPLALGGLGAPLTMVFWLGLTNAMNFIDGLNGLAAGVTLMAALALAGAGALAGEAALTGGGLLLAGAVLGFLPFNFPRARIFMGDVGSQFCGFMLGLLGVVAARAAVPPVSALLVPLLLSGVLFDVGFTLIRRLLAGEHIARAHNGHLYQVAARSGVNARAVALLHWGFAGLGGACALALPYASASRGAGLLGLVLLVQLIWAGFVVRRARQARLGRWSV